MAGDRKHIFISHIHEDDGRLSALKDLMKRKGLEVRDSSINSSKPNNAQSEAYIKYQILKPRIEWAGTLVVLISPDTKHSDWVNWEIECAEQMGMRIVGVWDHGAAQCDLPEALEQYADAIVGWNGDRVIDAINGDINNGESPEGTRSKLPGQAALATASLHRAEVELARTTPAQWPARRAPNATLTSSAVESRQSACI